MDDIKLEIKDFITPVLKKMAANVADLSPVMAEIENQIISPMRLAAWNKSGLHSRSGELLGAVETWHGKKSVGVSLKTSPGKDLIIPKASTHTKGAKAGSFKKAKFSYKVKGYTTKTGRIVKPYKKGRLLSRLVAAVVGRKHPHPWGDIPARPFFAKMQDLNKQQPRMMELISEHLTSNV